MRDRLHLNCSCGSHLAQFEVGDDEPKELWISMWELGAKPEVAGWRERLRWCWKILKDGDMWGDHVCLTVDQSRVLVSFLQEKFPNPVDIVELETTSTADGYVHSTTSSASGSPLKSWTATGIQVKPTPVKKKRARRKK